MPEVGRNFPSLIEAMCDVGYEDTVPRIFRKWATISAIAGALGRRCWLDVDRDVRIFAPMLVVLIGSPALGKGTSLTVPYYKCFSRLAVSLWADKKDREEGLHQAYGLDWPLFMQTGRMSPEKLVDGLAGSTHTFFDIEPPVTESSVTVVTDEIGVLLRSFTEGFRNLFTDAWDGRAEHSHSMRTGGVVIVKEPCINWIAGATPSTFLEHFPRDSKEQGLLSRTIPVFHGGAVQPGAGLGFKQKTSVPEADIEFFTRDLAKISMIRGSMSAESTALEEQIDKDCRYGFDPLPLDPVMSEYLKRRASHAMKIAMVVSASKRSNRIITAEDWEETKQILVEVEKSMPLVLRLFGMQEAGKIAFELHDRLGENGGMPITKFKRELLKAVKNSGELQGLYQAMIDCDMIKVSGQKVKASMV